METEVGEGANDSYCTQLILGNMWLGACVENRDRVENVDREQHTYDPVFKLQMAFPHTVPRSRNRE